MWASFCGALASGLAERLMERYWEQIEELFTAATSGVVIE